MKTVFLQSNNSVAGRRLRIENVSHLFYAAKEMLTQLVSASDLMHVSELSDCGNDTKPWPDF